MTIKKTELSAQHECLKPLCLLDIILKGEPGTGKNITTQFLCGCVLGEPAGFQTGAPSKDMFGPHSTAIKNCVLALFDEINMAEMKPLMPQLKNLITALTANVNPKCKDAYTVRSLVNSLSTTNDDDPIPMQPGDRRMVVIQTSSKKRGDTAYFVSLLNYLKREDVARAYFQYLRDSVDVTPFLPFQSTRPITQAYKTLRAQNIPLFHRFLSDLVKDVVVSEPKKSPAVHTPSSTAGAAAPTNDVVSIATKATAPTDAAVSIATAAITHNDYAMSIATTAAAPTDDAVSIGTTATTHTGDAMSIATASTTHTDGAMCLLPLMMLCASPLMLHHTQSMLCISLLMLHHTQVVLCLSPLFLHHPHVVLSPSPKVLHNTLSMLCPSSLLLHHTLTILCPSPLLLHHALSMLCPSPLLLHHTLSILCPSPLMLLYILYTLKNTTNIHTGGKPFERCTADEFFGKFITWGNNGAYKEIKNVNKSHVRGYVATLIEKLKAVDPYQRTFVKKVDTDATKYFVNKILLRQHLLANSVLEEL